MDQIRVMVQMSSQGRSVRHIARQTGFSRNTVRAYLRQLEHSGRTWEELLGLEPEMLAGLCFDARKPPCQRHQELLGMLEGLGKDLAEPRVTRQILWEEYRLKHPGGYGYTQFCQYLNAYMARNDVTMVFSHRPGAKLMGDYAGDKLSYVDEQTGEVVWCEVLVAVLPYSNLIYVEAERSQKGCDFTTGLGRTMAYFGGVTESIVFDNLKSGVTRADRYEPVFNDLCIQLSLHYGTDIVAARVAKPRDKAAVESAVNTVYNRIYPKLRNRTFRSLVALNAAIREALEELNNRCFKGRDYSPHLSQGCLSPSSIRLEESLTERPLIQKHSSPIYSKHVIYVWFKRPLGPIMPERPLPPVTSGRWRQEGGRIAWNLPHLSQACRTDLFQASAWNPLVSASAGSLHKRHNRMHATEQQDRAS